MGSEEHYEVECVVKHRKSVKKAFPKYDEDGERCYEYFVKWKGWDASTNTWEHQQNLANCKKLIDAYWADRESKKKEKEQKKKTKSEPRIEIEVDEQNETEYEPEKELSIVSIVESEKEERQKKAVPKKKYKATRTLILSDSEEDEEEEDENEECDDAPQIELNEDVKEEEVDQDVHAQPEEEEVEENASRKRSFLEKIESNEPPLKKRKFEETKRIIMSKGVDLFVDMLENGNEDIQNALVELIQQFEAK